MKIRKLIELLDKKYPLDFAEGWDNCGLQIGSLEDDAKRILVSLEVTDDVVNEAINGDYDFIITHHPLIFNDIKAVTYENPSTRNTYQLLKNGIGVFSMHSNLDISDDGTNDYLCNLLGYDAISYIDMTHSVSQLQLSFYSPAENVKDISEKLFEIGCGYVGNYSCCSFSIDGRGSYLPEKGANPYIGSVGNIETADEVKVEMILKESLSNDAVEALKCHHPYETVAYNIIKLENNSIDSGIGRYFDLETPMNITDLSVTIKDKLKLEWIRRSNFDGNIIKRVGICSGSGSTLIDKAKQSKCDVLVTGDIKHHDYRHAEELGIHLIDIGHFESENIFSEKLKKEILNMTLIFEKKIVVETSKCLRKSFISI